MVGVDTKIAMARELRLIAGALDLLAAPWAPTALFTAQNNVTVGAVRGIHERGIQHRVALVGFDDIPLADVLSPGISVIAQDPSAIGRLAAGVAFRRLAGDRSPPETVVVPTHLRVRGSGEDMVMQENESELVAEALWLEGALDTVGEGLTA